MEQISTARGKRLYLRDQTPEDSVVAVSYNDDSELRALDPPVGVQETPTFYSIIVNENPGEYFHIGVMAAYNYTGTEVELGIRIWDRNYWNKGYGKEATDLLVSWTFKNTGVSGIYVKAVQSNMRARKCYEKCGFRAFHNGMLEGYEMVWMVKIRGSKHEQA